MATCTQASSLASGTENSVIAAAGPRTRTPTGPRHLNHRRWTVCVAPGSVGLRGSDIASALSALRCLSADEPTMTARTQTSFDPYRGLTTPPATISYREVIIAGGIPILSGTFVETFACEGIHDDDSKRYRYGVRSRAVQSARE